MRLTDAQSAAAEALAGDAHLYLCGPPGRGKTQVVDWFICVVSATGTTVRRRHVHEFFADIHAAIDRNGGWRGGLDDVLRGVDVLCLDEFAVHDPADGVFLDRILRALTSREIRVIVTSNRTPAEQMPNPLFHVGFEPTVAFIDEVFTMVDVGGTRDLRAGGGTSGFRGGQWIVGAAPGPPPVGTWSAPARAVRLSGTDGRTAWMDFAALCEAPTAAADYLQLAERFDHWVIVGVDIPDGVDPLARWATVLDVAHDSDVRVDVWASCERDDLASALTRTLPDAARTVSRMTAWRVSRGS
ncbi:cell division protein ZapE [Gordonia sp. PDNC005]|nr:cell division protein ZapE [Gordonia sp. PDNC005]